ncbi:MAG: aminotransferase class III-fold pyridoxal phosphate-dependent enzyme [Candidatus Dormibacteraeota bacterium]|nr:aminotransferase class III-fold pyridoxal phosphate-dependent enzyme [Candidatus Dormibacteraeota bacterium]
MKQREAAHPADLARRAGAVLAGGSTHIIRAYQPPLYVVRAEGSRKWTVDGRELVDYTMGHGALLLGHAHPAVVEAVQRQAAAGTHYGAGHPLEIEWAELICSLVPSVEQVRFTSSGTEATMLALRLARAFTGRDVVAKLHEHFHGWHDAVSVDLGPDGTPRGHAGVPAAVTALTRVVDPGVQGSLEHALEDGAVAALILEASGAHYGGSPLPDGWVANARRVCDATGTLLVIDEVVTGFRVAPGGMQELLGVRPDLSSFGKVVAGGLPGGAVGGRREVMELLAGAEGEGRTGEAPRVAHPGTYNANPLSAAAGVATLRLVADGSAQQHAARTAAELERLWRDRLDAAGVPGRVWRLESILHTELGDPGAQAGLGSALRERNVDLLRTSMFVSTAHTEADLELTQTALDSALQARRA